MSIRSSFTSPRLTKSLSAVCLLAAGSLALQAQNSDVRTSASFYPGNLVVSRSVYDNNPANVTVGEILPPNCTSTKGGCAASSGATNNGSYPYVFNNVLYDSSFGITSRIYLDQIDILGHVVSTCRCRTVFSPPPLQRKISSLPASAPNQKSAFISL